MQSMKLLFVTLAFVAFTGKTIKIKTMFTNKEIVQKLFEQAINQRKSELFQEIIDTGFVGLQGQRGPAAFQAIFDPLIHAFPDIRYTVEDMVAEGDKVAVRWTWQGTHQALFRNIPATGKVVSTEGISIFGFRDGKIISAATLTDRLGFLEKLGVVNANL
jgi:steroid delta-isomerase-like uncharacterized protein